MTKSQVLVSSLLLILLLVACAPVAAPAPAPRVPASAAAPSPVLPAPQATAAAPVPAAVPLHPATPAWQEQWETVLAEAKKEGRVAMVTSAGSDMRSALMKVGRMQSLAIEILSGSAAEIQAKVLAERRAGLYLYDLSLYSPAVVVSGWKPAGILERLDSALILPEVTDPNQWYQGKLPWVDQDHTTLLFSLQPILPIAINTSLVKPDEVKSWRDILDPKWKGKLVLHDPTVAGAGQRSIQTMVRIMGEGYVRELANTQPVILRNTRQQMEWLAQGKVSIVVAPKPEELVAFTNIGAPVRGIIPAEGTHMSGGTSGVSMFTKAPYPNAAKAFINSLATREGQTHLALAGGFHSTKLDVTTSHLPPERIRVEGGKSYNADTEEILLARPVTDKLAKDIFGPLVK